MNPTQNLDRRSYLREVAVSSGALMFAPDTSGFMAQATPNWKSQIGLELSPVRDLLTMQLDIGWACIGGRDPIAMFKKHPRRYELWHVKAVKYKNLDPKLAPSQRQRGAQIVAMGEGDIDYRAVFANAGLAGLKYFVIEQDTAGQGGCDAIEDCRIAYENLSKILS